mmetsp:Transcript_52777/g.78650  ORF Transcript_52777/g.78650 Transcript_52777/m.78650 type:complete len:983 (+) Transcript_52777:73-3021(+)
MEILQQTALSLFLILSTIFDKYGDKIGTDANLSPSNNDQRIDFFDRKFNSGCKISNKTVSNKTIVTDGNANYTLTHLPMFLDFELNSTSSELGRNGLQSIATALMAIVDVNIGFDKIIPEISKCHSDKNTNLRFTTEFVDTTLNRPFEAACKLFKLLNRRGKSAECTEGNVVETVPSGIIGAPRSSLTESLAILGGASDLVTISHASSSAEFSHENEYPLFGRTIPSVEVDATMVVSFFKEELNATHLGVLYVNDPYGISYANSIRKAAGNGGITVKQIALLENASREDATSSLMKLKQTRIRYIIGIFNQQTLNIAMPLANEMNLTGDDYFWMFTDSFFGIRLTLQDNPDLQRALNGSGVLATSTGRDLLEGTRFYDAYTSRFLSLWYNEEGSNYLQSKLPGINLTLDLIKGREPSIFHLFLYEAVVALCLASCDAFSANPTFTANELYESFRKTSFDGVYGQVLFDSKTGDRLAETSEYAVYNIFVKEGTLQMEAIYRNRFTSNNDRKAKGRKEGTLHTEEKYRNSFTTNIDRKLLRLFWERLENKEFIYSDGTNTPPDNLPPLKVVNDFVPDTTSAIVCLCICGFLLLLIVYCAVWTYRRRKTKVVRAAQPIFLYLLCAGTFLMTLALISESLTSFNLGDDGRDATCMVSLWLSTLGFEIAFSALFSKTIRINRIMAMGTRLKRVVVKPKDVMKLFFTLLSTNLTILITWTAVEPLKYERYLKNSTTDEFGRHISTFGSCYPPLHLASNAYWVFMSVRNANITIPVLLSCYHAYYSRSLSTEYNESFYIAATVFGILQSIFLNILIIFNSYDTPTTRLYMYMFVLFIINVAILGPMFVPKMIALRKEQEERLEKEKRKKERLERLRRFDDLKKDHEYETRSLMMAAPSPEIADQADEKADENDSVESVIDEGHGIKITAFSDTDALRRLQMKLTDISADNEKLKETVRSRKEELDLVRSTDNSPKKSDDLNDSSLFYES